MFLDPAVVRATARPGFDRQHPGLRAASRSVLPRCLRVLADTYQRRLDFWMPIHRAPEVFRRDVVLPKVRVCERDDKVVV